MKFKKGDTTVKRIAFSFLALALLALAAPAAAQQANGLTFAPLGYQQITPTVSTLLTVPDGATRAVIVAEAQAVRWRDDGTAPTAAVGMPLAVGVTLEYSGTLRAIRFIEQTSAAKLNVSYYR